MTIKGNAAARLIEAWHGPLTAGALAKQFRLSSVQVLQRFWQKAKAAGLLPTDRPRPYFADRSAPAAAHVADLIDDDADAAEMSDADIAREVNVRHALNVASCAASLAALMAAHPELNDPKFHHYATAPARFGGNARA
ncbi:MAG: hypothetical protein OJF48_003429 [Afipia sp.]|jgi:hypothetical protein|nr:MAG: hypothetical protein OJF48_003429 [Afipia sp.]